MEKNTKAYIVVNLGVVVPKESHEEHGIKQLNSGKLYLRNVITTVQIAAEDAEMLTGNELNSLTYEGMLVHFNDKFWTFDLNSPLGVCASAVLGSSMTHSSMVLDEDKTFDAALINEALNSFKGKPILDTLLGVVNATLTTPNSVVRTLCWETGERTPLSLLLDELGNAENDTALEYAELTMGTLTRSFYNYVDDCESFLAEGKVIPVTDPAFPVSQCWHEGTPINVRELLSNIECPRHTQPNEVASVDTEPKGVRLSDFDTPNFLRNVAREGIERAERSAERIRGRLDTRDSRDRRLVRNEDLEDDVRDIVRDLELVFNRVDRILSDMDTRVPAGAALAVTAILEEKVKEIQKVVSDARKDSLIIMLEKEISIGRGSSSFSLKEGLLELLDDQERNNSDRRDRRRVRSGYRGWAEVDCRRRDCDCEECQDDRRRRDRRDDRDRRSSHIRRKRW